MPDEDDKDLYNGERGPAWRKYRRDMLSTARVVDKDKFFKCRDYAMGVEENW